MKKKRKKWSTAQNAEFIADMKRKYPPEKVNKLISEGVPEEQAAARLGLGLTDYKVLLCLYRCTGDLKK